MRDDYNLASYLPTHDTWASPCSVPSVPTSLPCLSLILKTNRPPVSAEGAKWSAVAQSFTRIGNQRSQHIEVNADLVARL